MCRPVRSVIILVINKSDSHCMVIQFCYHSYDNWLNWTPLSPITITYYIDRSVLLENTPVVKFIQNHIRDSGGVFSMSSLVKILMISLISSLSLKLKLNSLVFDWNILWSSSKVLGNLQQSSEIFGNLRKLSGNVWQCSCELLTSFGESSEIFGKSSKTPLSVCLYNKKNIAH